MSNILLKPDESPKPEQDIIRDRFYQCNIFFFNFFLYNYGIGYGRNWKKYFNERKWL